MWDRYGADVLARDGAPPDVVANSALRHRANEQLYRYGNENKAPSTPPQSIAAKPGLVLEHPGTGWVGAVTRVQKMAGVRVIVLEDRFGKTRSFPLDDVFSIDGKPVTLAAPLSPPATASPAPLRTASGSRAVKLDRARVARGSRIWVEGKHDAELIEKVWGDDLRIEGVVVEELSGVDNLAAALADFKPTMSQRIGVLVDHLLPGTKEHHLAAAALATVPPGSVIVLGHPYVDVWQAVLPARLGLPAWPVVTRGTEWKIGILNHLGWPAQTQTDVALAWRSILASVRDYRDLDPALLGRVEELIDFVTIEN